ANVDSSKRRDGFRDGRFDLLGEADVALDRQRLAPRLADRFGRGVNRARKLGVRLDRFRHDRDPRPISRSPQRDRQPNAATGPRYKQNFTCKRWHESPTLRSAVNSSVTITSRGAIWERRLLNTTASNRKVRCIVK